MTQERNIPEHRGTALITGASSGIGAIYAHRLAKQGYDLIIVARNGERLKALASRLTDETGRTVETVTADLGNRADLARVEGVLRQDRSITLLVNNAGFGGTAPLLSADVDKMQEMIELNVTALTRLTYAAVPGFVARGGRHDHQHRLHRRDRAGASERRLRRYESLRARIQPVAEA